ncbi:T9SS type B sorting domain-containing protein [Nonlabens xiamenensis]|uniref:T9SS type B sorting domain-containing protein n=1 Tax=Nonlabens xiamenensis TaxID=2341043 RepID=UPI000F613230|nr:T9SS type B sorting domain-containing protein [Nonlabens xiamenensis]
MRLFLQLALLFFSLPLFAQQVLNMPANSQIRSNSCAYAFVNDSGGSTGNYGINENGQILLCPTIPTDRVQMNIPIVDIGPGDFLTIYDGDSVTSPVLATATNTTMPLGMLRASPTNPTGCLLVTFTSNSVDNNNAGWRADRTCFDPCQSITTNIVTTPAADPSDGIVKICQGDTVTFDGSATFGTDGTGATYEWDLADGNGLNPGQVQTATYTTPGIYQTRFVVTDNTGCTDREEIDLTVFVSTTPDFTGTMASDPNICFGESTDLTGVVTPQNFAISPSPPVTGQTFLPDGSGVSYQTCIDVDLFPQGASVNAASDIVDFFLNMEHSYLGDLEVLITAPNGSQVSLHEFSNGGNTFLGVPIDVDSDLTPGTGFDYVFNESAAQTWAQAAIGNGTIQAGDYLPVDPYSNFIGSPLNGQWCITVTDNLGSDNGYIFYWGINFNPAIIPGDLSFTPASSSEQWLPDPSITANNGNVITVTPTTSGQNCYTFEFIDDFGCTYTTDVCINVEQEILDAVPNDIVECNATGNVDLTQNDAVVLNGLSTTDHVVTYHTSLADAENAVNSITNPATFTPTSNPQTIYATITNLTTNCLTVDPGGFTVEFVDFGQLSVPDLNNCGPLVNFDLTAYVNANLMGSGGGGTSGSGFNLTFHPTMADAQAGSNALPDPYTQLSGSQTIYIRVESTADPSCNAILPFMINVSANVVANPVNNLETCDDVTNDGVELFNLITQIPAILGTQNPADFVVTFHELPVDAASGANPINATSYSNTTSPQTIYARVESVFDPSCADTNSFDLIVNRRAVVAGVNDLETCDDLSNDGIEVFDLTTLDATILGAQDPAQNSIRFFQSQADAMVGNNPIVNPMAYANATPNMETIHVRIENNSSPACYSIDSFNLIVHPQPQANPIADIEVCDDLSNDGVASFALDVLTPTVLGAQDPMLYAVTYHESQADAASGNSPITNTAGFNNTTSPQTIWVRVENNNAMQCEAFTDFDLIVNPVPDLTTPPDLTLCDDPSADGTESFDLTQNNLVLLNGLNPNDYTITYTSGGNAVNATYNNVSSPETITATVTNNLTLCTNSVMFDLIVSPVPDTNNSVVLEECDADMDGSATFSLSDATTAIIAGQSNVNITYHENLADALAGNAVLDENAYNSTANPQTIHYRIVFDTGCFTTGTLQLEAVDAPIAVMPMDLEVCDSGDGSAVADLSSTVDQITAGQLGNTVSFFASQSDADAEINELSNNFTFTQNTSIIARVDDNNTDCVSFTTLNLVFNELPEPVLLPQYVVCKDENGNLVNGPEILDTGLSDAMYDFEWMRDGTVLADNTAAIEVEDAGNYEVIATEIATGCQGSTTTNVRVASVPDIYNVEVTTDPFDKTHQVIATAEGPDNYWFSLDDGPYLYTGIFNDVSPGPHTVTIAERSGCGEIVVEIFVFGYPDYFTPNADGIHDTWNIVGGDRLPGTKLYIFDRYGKLIKQLDTTGPGWDGSYNGQPLPSTDYWFKIEYSFDGQTREASGHFAMKR